MIIINLTYLGNETMAEAVSDGDDSAYLVQTGRNGAEAVSKMVALLREHHKKGTPYEVPQHAMKGVL